MDTHITCLQSAQLSGSAQIEFDLSEQRKRIHAVCECVATNQRDRLKRIRSGSAWTTCSWTNTCRLCAYCERRLTHSTQANSFNNQTILRSSR